MKNDEQEMEKEKLKNIKDFILFQQENINDDETSMLKKYYDGLITLDELYNSLKNSLYPIKQKTFNFNDIDISEHDLKKLIHNKVLSISNNEDKS